MSEGYLFRAIGADKYFDMNICLAASLRYHKDQRPISVFTDKPYHKLFRAYPKLFDKLIDVRPLIDDLKVKFNRDFSDYFELGGLAPRLLCRKSLYDKTISIDGDCMALSSTEPLWRVFDDYHITFLGSARAYPGWGSMTADDMTIAEIQIEDDLREEGKEVCCYLREAHGGMMWWDKSVIANEALDEFDIAIKHGRLYKYFPKVVDVWQGSLSDEVVYTYIMSILDLPIVPYNSNLMGSNPTYFSVEKSEGSMGHFLTDPRLKGHMKFKDTVPVLVHFFAKDKDPNYEPNRDFLFKWLETNNFVEFNV